MAQQSNEQQQKSAPTQSLPFQHANKRRQQAEERAVAGRNKKNGQKRP